MRLEEYTIMRELEDTYWWHRVMRSLMAEVLLPCIESDSRLLDIGCGTGANLAMLSDYCKTSGIDIHPEAVYLSRQRGLENIYQADATMLPFEDDTFTHATCSGVMQMIDDDQKCLSEAFRVLEPGGTFYITEQAYPMLLSRHDVSQGAIRRYSRQDLKSKLLDAGFTVERLNYANKLALPLIATVRLTSRLLRPPKKARTQETRSNLFSLPRPLNEALHAIFQLETRNTVLERIPAGLAMIALSRKPDAPAAVAGGLTESLQAPADV